MLVNEETCKTMEKSKWNILIIKKEQVKLTYLYTPSTATFSMSYYSVTVLDML